MTRAEELTARRRLVTGLGIAVAVALVALVVGIMRGDGSDSGLRTAAGAATTDSAPDAGAGALPSDGQTATTAGASVLGTQFTNTTTTVPSQTTVPPVITGTAARLSPTNGPATPQGPGSTATTALVCRNSTNPKCGQFRWDPPPKANEPAQMAITASPAQPKVGEKVTFKVTIDDPDDASPAYCYWLWDYGDTHNLSTHCDYGPGGAPQCQGRYGPWTPPAATPGHYEDHDNLALEHTYDSPGNYTVKFTYNASYAGCYDPYASDAVGTMSLTVLPAPPVGP
jgi:hypothetical protein